MDAEAIAIDHPDPSIIDFVQNSGLVPRGMSARFERLPGGVSSDIWLVHAGDRSFCVKRALAQLRVAADWRAPIERNTKEAGWIKAVAGFMPEAVPALLAEIAAAGMFAMDYLRPQSFEVWKSQLQAIGAKVVYTSREPAADSPIPFLPLAELLPVVDVLSLHLPLTP